jgi:hypothetical protein
MTPCNEPDQPQHYPSYTYSSSSTSSTDARCGCRCTKPPACAASWPVGCGADSTSAGASWTGVAVPPGSGEAPFFLSLRRDWPFAACLAACLAAFFSFLMRFLFLMSSGVWCELDTLFTRVVVSGYEPRATPTRAGRSRRSRRPRIGWDTAKDRAMRRTW